MGAGGEEEGVQSSCWELGFKGPEPRKGPLLKAAWDKESQGRALNISDSPEGGKSPKPGRSRRNTNFTGPGVMVEAAESELQSPEQMGWE